MIVQRYWTMVGQKIKLRRNAADCSGLKTYIAQLMHYAENSTEVFHHAACLSGNVSLHEIASGWIKRYLPGDVDKIADFDRLLVWTDRFRGALGGNNLFLHRKL